MFYWLEFFLEYDCWVANYYYCMDEIGHTFCFNILLSFYSFRMADHQMFSSTLQLGRHSSNNICLFISFLLFSFTIETFVNKFNSTNRDNDTKKLIKLSLSVVRALHYKRSQQLIDEIIQKLLSQLDPNWRIYKQLSIRFRCIGLFEFVINLSEDEVPTFWTLINSLFVYF